MASQPDTERGSDEPSGLEGHLAQFFLDSTLWPVLIVLITAFVSFGSAMLFFGVVERNPFALGALAITLVMSIDLVLRDRRRGRFGLISRCVVGFWLLSGGVATALARAGF